MMKVVMTYGTFDLFHIGHLNILERLSKYGDRLIVGVSTDDFNRLKGKECIFSYPERSRIVASLSCVHEVIPEHSWEQKEDDIRKYDVCTLGIGDDWLGEFDYLSSLCDIVYLPRTDNISTTILKENISLLNKDRIREIQDGLDGFLRVVQALK